MRLLIAVLIMFGLFACQQSKPSDLLETQSSVGIIQDDLSAGVMTLRAPLTSAYESPLPFDSQKAAIQVSLTIPQLVSGALGCGVYISDDEGNWLHRFAPKSLSAGSHNIVFKLQDPGSWPAPTSAMPANNYRRELAKHFGCYFWSEHDVDGEIQIHACQLIDAEHGLSEVDHEIVDVVIGDYAVSESTAMLSTGKRWELHFNPAPFPKEPYQSSDFKADLHLIGPDGKTLVIPSFYMEPMKLKSMGSHQTGAIAAAPYFCVRFRPQRAGRYKAKLVCEWEDGVSRVVDLPDLDVHGADWDDMVRTDKDDSRFLSVNDQFFWPTGINLKSANDDWCHAYLRTIKTPNLGTETYEQYLGRLQRSGANVTEIWMCNWNFALEWYDDWPSYHGLDGYSALHAQQLDDVLDSAYEKGIRVILSFRNHGQAHTRSGNRNIPSDTNEWHYNPYNKQVGGFLNSAVDLFSNEQAFQRQENLHRYICARYADHPAIMMWKLWSEVDITDAAKKDSHIKFTSTPALESWHDRISKHLSEHDIYDHLICAHFSTDFHRADTKLFKLKHVSAICINAYLWRLAGAYGRRYTLAQLLYDSIHTRGAFRIHKDILGELGKPIVVSEFGGGNPFQMTERELRAHHLCAPWAAAMSGHAMGPLFFWYEWIDQNDHWWALGSIKRFLKGEDLRGKDARSVVLSAEGGANLWARAWARPGRIMAYVMDARWGMDGARQNLISDGRLKVGSKVKAGEMTVEYWDASLGRVIERKVINHPGGNLTLQLPAFRRHIAVKCWRHK